MHKLNDDAWNKSAPYLASDIGGYPPSIVHHSIALLLGDEEVTQSRVEYVMGIRQADGSEKCTWRVWVTTAHHLAHVDVEIDADTYTLDEEQERYRQINPAVARVRAAWIRPLSAILELALVGDTSARSSAGRERWIRIPAIKLSFAHLQPVSIPVDVADRRGEKERTASFVDVLRGAVQQPHQHPDNSKRAADVNE
ncbi:hypothetical protein [Rhodococcus sp. 077-4]|uniref:hypothetical protein n=1 Tax=Rhodococcus sp. 077-4 TaxID=2789271 RepID=UPI0039F5585A